MSSPDILVLGLLLLASNLTLCALFAPAKRGSGGAHHLLRLWKLLGLALLNIASWSIVLEQGGATKGFSDSFLRTASVFALMGGYYDGAAMLEPWNAMAPLIALNGLLFIPCALVPTFFPSFVAVPTAACTPAVEPLSAPAPVSAEPAAAQWGSEPMEKQPAAPSEKQTPLQPAPAAVPAASAVSRSPVGGAVLNPAASPLMATLEDLPEPSFSQPAADPNEIGVYRASVPKGPALSPAEAEYAAQMKPLGPTPPPIRFGRPS